MTEPLVSIIIPLYNAERYIESSIESAINQSYKNKEILIIDDGSTDNSYAIAKKYEAENIIVLKQKNAGASVARNHGLSKAKGSYIQFLDADDILSIDKISSQIEILNGSIAYVALCATVNFEDGENYKDKPIIKEWYSVGSHQPFDFLIKLYSSWDILPGYGGMIQPNAWLTPKKIIDKAGLWKEYRSPDDDGEFFCRIILASKGIKYANNGVNYYRKFKNNESLSGQKSYDAYASIIETINLKYNYLKEKKDDPLIDKIMARHYWNYGILTYPQFRDLSKYCINKSKELGFRGSYIGGKNGRFLSNFFGWRLIRIIHFLKKKLYKRI